VGFYQKQWPENSSSSKIMSWGLLVSQVSLHFYSENFLATRPYLRTSVLTLLCSRISALASGASELTSAQRHAHVLTFQIITLRTRDWMAPARPQARMARHFTSHQRTNTSPIEIILWPSFRLRKCSITLTLTRTRLFAWLMIPDHWTISLHSMQIP
jgi:hypothetical protein